MSGTTYTNTTGHTIVARVAGRDNGDGALTTDVGGISIVWGGTGGEIVSIDSVTIPHGVSYKVTAGDGCTVNAWSELR